MSPLHIEGKTFGQFIVIGLVGSDRHHKTVWFCKCSCGNLFRASGSHIVSGHTNSCGCHRQKMIFKHGKYLSRTYRIWLGMKTRCQNPNDNGYKRWYGSRGIGLCDKWQSFAGFYADMGDASTGMTIDRINNNGDYETSNCRWSTRAEQANNRSTNVIIEFNGEALNITQ